MLALAWRSGLRCGEVLALASKDVNLEEGTITIQRGKGGKRRVVGLDQGTAELGARCIEAKKKRRIRSVLLFSTLEGNQIDSSYVRHLLTRLARRCGGEWRFLQGCRNARRDPGAVGRMPATEMRASVVSATLARSRS